MQQQSNPGPQKNRMAWLWWILALALLAWNIFAFLPHASQQVSIPYSAFISQVNAENVASVQISGSQISGKFVKPVTWPQASSGAAAANATPGQYSDFTTVFPDVEGDPNFVSTLQSHNVIISVTPPPSPLISILFTYALPALLFLVVMFWIMRRSAVGQSTIMSIGRSKAREYNVDRPDVTFDDVAGVDEAKQELKEVVDFLRNPAKYHKVGARIPAGVLLVGPPGTGKTLMARAVAGEARVPFFSISASEFVEMFVGVGASRVRDLFNRAKAEAPSIVFIDELDAVGRRRGTGLGNTNDEREQTLNQLLVEMGGFDEHHETIVIAATNRPDVLDPALLRPGRFDRQITVGLPDRRGREKILQIHVQKLSLAPDVDLTALARSTTGFSGADLANLCNEAALFAARDNHDEIHQPDFEAAIDRVMLGEKRNLALNDKERQVIAYHESGHALVAWLTSQADAVNKVTIIPRGRALGVTEQMPMEDKYNYSQEYLMARLAVMLGGRSAEEIALKSITTGAENDLAEATKLARRMVTRWGMSSLGLLSYSSDGDQPFLGYELAQGREYSEETAAQIDKNMQKLLDERHQYARRTLEGAREKLDRLVDALLQEETLSQDDLERILGPRTVPVGDPEALPSGIA